MRIGVFLGHPAHYHMLKNAARQWQEDGNQVFFVIKKKDILERLLQEAGYSYSVIREGRRNNKLGMIHSVIEMEWKMCAFLRKNKVDILVGTTLSFASRVIMRTPVVVMCEDDAAVVPYFAKLSYPWANVILNPTICNSGKWNEKAIKYEGYQKLAYLHPHRFTPSFEKIQQYGINVNEPYFLLRFVSYQAHHDGGVKGINSKMAIKIVTFLSSYGRVYITSERPLEPHLEQYRIQINPLDIHDVMAYASLFVSDSQSMSVEAALLGVPSIRCSGFSGRISVLEELEHKYQLTFGFKPEETDRLFVKLEEILALPNVKEVFLHRRQKMLADTIDVSAFLIWFIENYPQSAKIMKTNWDYQYRFK